MDSVSVPDWMRMSVNQSWDDGHVGNVDHRIEIGNGILAGHQCVLAEIMDLSFTAKMSLYFITSQDQIGHE